MGTHFATVLGAWLGYAVAYTLLHDVLAPHAGVMAFVPVVVSGWFGGAFAGIVAGLATVPVTVLVAIAMGFGVGSGLSQSTLVGAAAMMLVGYVVGHVRSLNRRIVLQMTAHQQDERALRGSESRFRALVDRNLDGVAVAIDGKIVFVNPTFSKMFGYTEAKLLGVEASVLLVAQDKERARQRIRTQTQSGEVLAAAVFEGIRSDGTHFFLEVLSRQIEFDGKPALLSQCRDLTDRRRQESALREAEEKYRTLVEHSLAGVSIIQHRRFRYVNPKFAETLGYTQRELTALPSFMDVVYEDDRAVVEEKYSQRLEDALETAHRGGPRNSDSLLRWDPDPGEGVWHATEETELSG